MPAPLYSWDEWFGRQRFVLRRGTDYRCSQSVMAQQIRNNASVRGLLINLVEGDDHFTVIVRGEKKDPHRPHIEPPLFETHSEGGTNATNTF